MTNKEAIEELKGLQEFINGTRLKGEIRAEAFDLAIKALESSSWIPVTERLPRDDESYYMLCCDKYGAMLIAHPFADESSNTGYSAESDECFMYDCMAWMPLPEPYKEDT